jgi:energy-coupling factor transport system permease protein
MIGALYLDRPSFVQQRHPVMKVLALLLFFVASFVVDHPLFLLPLTVGMFLLIFLSGCESALYRLRILFVSIFIFTVLIWSVFAGRESPLLFPPFPFTQEGILFGFGTALRLGTILATGTLLLATTRVEELAFAFTSLGLPYRIGFVLTLACRLVPLGLDAAGTVIQAQRCRGLDMQKGSLWQRVRQYVLVLVPVFMSSLRRADQMAITLEVRGFNSGSVRTSYKRTPWQMSDTVALVAVLGIASIYVGLWHAGYGQIQASR